MRRTITIPAAIALALIALSGCSAGSSSDSSAGAPAPMIEQAQEFSSDGTKTADLVVPADREVITTGYVTITVDDPMGSADDAVRITEQAGGRVDGRTEYAPKDETDKGSATLTLRVPADSLTPTLDKLRELGTVQEVSLNSNDVTMVTQDLEARIKALSASIDRLLVLQSSATDVDTLIQLETAISDRQAQLESLESERRYYSDQVSLSTITLNLVSEYNAPAEEPDTFLSGLVAGWSAFVAFFAGLLVALGVLLPWLVLAGIITAAVILIVRWNRRRKAATPAGPSPSE
ncbi:hypothetical protein BH09ACT5_BH09ACT5_02620 [soil metagenome]